MTRASSLPGGPACVCPSPSQVSFAQTTIVRQIAPITGSDANSGLPGSPWKTWRHYLDLIGSAFIDGGASHTILYLENAPASDPILPPNVGSTGALQVFADPSAIVSVRSSTFTAVQVNNPAANLAYEVTDGVFVWAPFVQFRITDTTVGREAWLLTDQGAGTARISIPLINFAPGDSYEIQTIPTIGAICFDNTSLIAGGQITFNDLSFLSGAIVPSIGTIDPFGNASITFNRCHLGGNASTPMQGTYNANVCLVVDPEWNDATPVLTNCGLLGGPFAAVGVFNSFVIANQCISQGAAVVVERGPLFVDDFGVFDSPAAGVQVDLGGAVQASGIIYGVGNAVVGAVVFRGNNAITWLVTAPTITGTGGDVRVGGVVVVWAAAPIDTFGAVISQGI